MTEPFELAKRGHCIAANGARVAARDMGGSRPWPDDALRHGYQILERHRTHPTQRSPVAFMVKREPRWPCSPLARSVRRS